MANTKPEWAFVEPTRLVPEQQPIRLAVFGDPGVGKTTLALNFPRPFVIDTDLGLEGDAVAGRDDIVFQRPTSYRDLERIYYWLKEHAADFDTIVFDSLDGLYRMFLDEVVEQGKAKATSYILEMVPETAEYLAAQKQVERVLSDFRRLGKHIVVTSAIRAKDNEKRTVNVAPGLQGFVTHWPSIMGELVVLRLDESGALTDKGKPTRVLMIDPSSAKRECKSRWSALLPYVTEPSFTKLWAAASTVPDRGE